MFELQKDGDRGRLEGGPCVRANGGDVEEREEAEEGGGGSCQYNREAKHTKRVTWVK